MGSALFYGLDATQCGEQQLDHRVVLELAHADELGCSGDDYPESGVSQDCFDVHWAKEGLIKS